METMTTVRLPHGLVIDGSRVRTARIRELNGRDERLLGRQDRSVIPAVRTTELLGRVATLGDTAEGARPDLARRLTVGDRVTLLLQLRRVTFGDRIDCVVTCPLCGGEMSVELSVDRLLRAGGRGEDEKEVSAGGMLVRLRPITGADLEELDAIPEGLDAAEVLVRSCITYSDAPLPEKLSPEAVAELSSHLEAMDPRAEIVLTLPCPSCGGSSKVPFSIEEFLSLEVDLRARRLDEEVHWLAFNYHWSEDEILSLPLRRRSKYIDLINRTFAGETI